LVFDIVLVKFGLQEIQAASADARPNLHSKESKLAASDGQSILLSKNDHTVL
jgi:hypothetical protein